MILLAMNWGNALIVTFLGFGIVFLILCLLIAVITLFGKAMAPRVSVKKTIKGNDPTSKNNEVISETILSGVHIPALDSAAIAMALHMYYDDIHDFESHVITIKNVERKYSPWNSKIYGINNNISR